MNDEVLIRWLNEDVLGASAEAERLLGQSLSGVAPELERSRQRVGRGAGADGRVVEGQEVLTGTG